MRYREVPEHVGGGGCENESESGIEDASGSDGGERAGGGDGDVGDVGLPRARNETEDSLSSHNPTRSGRHWRYQHWTWFNDYLLEERGVGGNRHKKI